MRRRKSRRNTLVIMARQPIAGAVKTRLARDIGSVRAVWWYRHNLYRVLRRLRGDPRWDLRVALSPDKVLARPHWLHGIVSLPQGSGDLGQRIERVLGGMPPGPVLVIGSDVPGVGREEIAQAFRALGSADVVLGPSGDGGYWIIGHRASVQRLPRGSLSGVRWSTRHALRDTEQVLSGRWKLALVQELHDVDRAADLAIPELATCSDPGRTRSGS